MRTFQRHRWRLWPEVRALLWFDKPFSNLLPITYHTLNSYPRSCPPHRAFLDLAFVVWNLFWSWCLVLRTYLQFAVGPFPDTRPKSPATIYRFREARSEKQFCSAGLRPPKRFHRPGGASMGTGKDFARYIGLEGAAFSKGQQPPRIPVHSGNSKRKGGPNPNDPIKVPGPAHSVFLNISGR